MSTSRTRKFFRVNFKIPFLVLLLSSGGCFGGPLQLPAGMEYDASSNLIEVPGQAPQVVTERGAGVLASVPLVAGSNFSSLQLSTRAVTAIALDPSGQQAYVGTRDGEIFEVQRAGDGRVYLVRRVFKTSKPITALALSSNGEKLALAQYSYVAVLDLRLAELSAQLTLVDGRILWLDWDTAGELVALGRANGDVFVWHAIANSTRELEQYSSATSPILGVQFHPFARALFVLERSGGLYLWRVLRTEYQLGLRDQTAQIDKAQQGRLVVPIGYLPGGASALWVSRDGSELMAMSQVGRVFSWTVRGLVRGQEMEVGPLNAAGLVGIRSRQTGVLPPLMVVGGRGQQIQLWCQAIRPVLMNEQSSVPVLVEGQALGAPPPLAPEGEFFDDVPSSATDTRRVPPGLLASSPVFAPSVVFIREAGGLLWIAFGDGSIATVDQRQLLNAPGVSQRLRNCIFPANN